MKLHVPTRKMKRQRNRFGFDLSHSALSRASEVLNIELSEQRDPLDAYFLGHHLNATAVAGANDFTVGVIPHKGNNNLIVGILEDGVKGRKIRRLKRQAGIIAALAQLIIGNQLQEHR